MGGIGKTMTKLVIIGICGATILIALHAYDNKFQCKNSLTSVNAHVAASKKCLFAACQTAELNRAVEGMSEYLTCLDK